LGEENFIGEIQSRKVAVVSDRGGGQGKFEKSGFLRRTLSKVLERKRLGKKGEVNKRKSVTGKKRTKRSSQNNAH